MRRLVVLALLFFAPVVHADGGGALYGVAFPAGDVEHPVAAVATRLKTTSAITHEQIEWANLSAGAPRELYEAAILASRFRAADLVEAGLRRAAAKADPERTLWGLLTHDIPSWDRYLDHALGQNYPLFDREVIWVFAPVLKQAPAPLKQHLLSRLPALYARSIALAKAYGIPGKGPKRMLDALARILIEPEEVLRAALRGRSPTRQAVWRAYDVALARMHDALLPADSPRVRGADIAYLVSLVPKEQGRSKAPILFGSFVNGQADPRRSDIDFAGVEGERRSWPATEKAMQLHFHDAGGLDIEDLGARHLPYARSGVFSTFSISWDVDGPVLNATTFAGYDLDKASKPIFRITTYRL